jgi:hypothetical protein
MATFRQAVCHLKSLSPYSQSRHHDIPKNPNENAVDHEMRTARKRLHTNKSGHIIIPMTAFTNSILEAAEYLSLPIPGKARSTFTKHFQAGVRVVTDLVLPLKADDAEIEAVFCHADGKRGPGPRVTRHYPRIDKWEGKVTYMITDTTITKDAFERALSASGLLIGIGRWRPRNRGSYGMFEVSKIEWTEG